MKKIILVSFAVSSLFSSVFSQEDSTPTSTDKMLSVGFNLGINKSHLATSSPIVDAENSLGFQLGVTGNYQFNSIFSLAPKLGVSMNEGKIVYKDEANSKNDFSPMALTTEFALHAMFTSATGSYHPFAAFGPSIKVPVSKENNPFVSDFNLSLDFSIGFKKGLKFFNLIPELRYSHGLTDINQNPDLESIKFHSVALILNFN